MSQFAIRLLILAVYATTLAVVPTAASAKAATHGSKHIKKHKRHIQRSPGFGDRWSAGQARPAARPPSQSGEVCPGNARSIDCKIWPPPIYDDPDRKVSGSDGG